jgi:hypothetical protein
MLGDGTQYIGCVGMCRNMSVYTWHGDFGEPLDRLGSGLSRVARGARLRAESEANQRKWLISRLFCVRNSDSSGRKRLKTGYHWQEHRSAFSLGVCSHWAGWQPALLFGKSPGQGLVEQGFFAFAIRQLQGFGAGRGGHFGPGFPQGIDDLVIGSLGGEFGQLILQEH